MKGLSSSCFPRAVSKDPESNVNKAKYQEIPNAIDMQPSPIPILSHLISNANSLSSLHFPKHHPTEIQLACHHSQGTNSSSNSSFLSQSPQKIKQNPLTSGTASLSACALAASVVTVLVATAALDQAALLRRGAALRLALNANIVLVKERDEGEEEKKEN